MSRSRVRARTETALDPDAGPPLAISPHGRWRRARRGFRDRQIEYVIRYDTPLWRAGAVFFVLRSRDLPAAHRRDDDRAKLVGTVVVVEHGVVSTVYRNDRPLRYVLKKPKYDTRRRSRPTPFPLDPEPVVARPLVA